MKNKGSETLTPTNKNISTNKPSQIVNTNTDTKNGQSKCPLCGSTDISLNVATGKLRCNFCRHEFNPIKNETLQTDLSKLEGQVMASGTMDIDPDSNDIITLKCESCGAEVVIDTTSISQARCHWCRNMLSINEQIPNGAIPDLVLPFGITKEEAKKQIENFVGKRKFFAHPKFKQEFSTENIMGVYLPYMIVDINSHVNLKGAGERLRNSYYDSNSKVTYYDADLYNVERDFDLVIDGLTVESSTDKLSKTNSKTNNVINAIMPFDLENCVKYDSNYLKGYTSEKRDINISQLEPIVENYSKLIAKFSANDSLKEYDRGVAWNSEQLDIKGKQWKSAYLPVWLYSYLQVKGNDKILHYVAVNARTKETMGSVPIHTPKLLLVSIIIEIFGFLGMMYTDFDYNWLFLLIGFIYYFAMYSRYRNNGARHKYETETKTNLTNLRCTDNFIKTERNLTSSKIRNANNNTTGNEDFPSQILNDLANTNPLIDLLKNDIFKK